MGSLDWDKMDFSYHSTDGNEEVTLPFKLLIIGDFSGSYREDIAETIRVDKRNFSKVMSSVGAGIAIEIAIDLDEEGVQFLDIEFKATSIEDFEPDVLVNKVGYLQAHIELINLLKNITTDIELKALDLTPEHLQILNVCGVKLDNLHLEELSFIVFDVNEHLHEIMSYILHNDRFQQQESIWRNLACLVNSVDDDVNCYVEILDLNKELLEEDFFANRDLQETALYDLVYLKEFGQYGGQPYSAIIADYYFSSGIQDIQLLRNISNVCSMAHAPFIAGASSKLFAADSFGSIQPTYDVGELFNGPKYIKWKGFQNEFESSYIGLVLPRIKLRPQYRIGAGQISELPFIENQTAEHDQFLYGNASFAYAACLIKSFAKYSVCTDLVGNTGGSVDIYGADMDVEKIYPNYQIESVFTDKQLIEMANLGFLTLGFNKSQQQMFFTSSASVRWGRFAEPNRPGDVNSQVEAQLPYIFIVSRIVHFLKVVQRDSIGSQKSLMQIQSELNKWLKRYVSDVENPAAAIRARKPLKKAEVVLSSPNEMGEQSLDLTIVPHLRFMGKDFSLSLNLSVE